MTAVEVAEAAVAAAETALTNACEDLQQAEDAGQRHREAVRQAEAELSAHEGNGIGCIENLAVQPEWRERRAQLAAEVDRLRGRSAAIAATLRLAHDAIRPRRAALQAAEETLCRARLRERIDSGALEHPVQAILNAWNLYVTGYQRAQDRICPESLGRWLFGPGGLYPLRDLLEQRKVEKP